MSDLNVLQEEAGPILLLDRSGDLQRRDVLNAFALDELLCRQTGAGGPAICHIWRHPGALVMGVRDSRLPGAAAASRTIRKLGYDVAVRHSGGAAVPLDPGVVNVSLIVPLSSGPGQGDFQPAFHRMAGLIEQALRGTGRQVRAGEIAGAFCPGAFDLSISGQKFCGIAQRRQSKALIVQAFIIAEGSGGNRADLVRAFYEEAAGDTPPELYPKVTRESTASLQELTSLGALAVPELIRLLKETVRMQQQSFSPEAMDAAAAALRLPREEEVAAMTQTLRQRYTS